MILIDTHIWLRWIIGGESALPERIEQRLNDADRLAISAISCWEVEMLQRKGRIDLLQQSSEWISNALSPSGVVVLPLSCEVSQIAALLPEHHKDPADRIIIATAVHHQCRLVSFDQLFPSYTELDGLLISG